MKYDTPLAKEAMSYVSDAKKQAKDLRLLELTSNRSILEKMELEGTNDYQQYVTSQTQGSMKKTFKHLKNYDNFYNVFCDNLINLIKKQIIHDVMLTNPLAKLPRIALPNMGAIQEIGQDIIRARAYNHNIGDEIFERNTPNPRTAYHTINRQEYFPITINRSELLAAFQEEGGLAKFIESTYNKLKSSDNVAEFLAMKEVFAKYDAEHNMFNVKVEGTTIDEEMKNLIKGIRKHAELLKMPNAVYNAYGLTTQTYSNNLVFITTPDVTVNIDVEVLAGAFNKSFTDVTTEVIVIDAFPTSLQIDNTYGVLMDKKAFIIADALLELKHFDNPLSLERNYWLHHWQVLSMSPFLSIVKFSSADDTPINQVSFTPTGFTTYLTNSTGKKIIKAGLFTGQQKEDDTFIVGDLEGTVSATDGSNTTTGIRKNLKGATYKIFTGSIPNPIEPSTPLPIVLSDKTFVDNHGILHLQDELRVEGAIVNMMIESTYVTDGFATAISTDSTIDVEIGGTNVPVDKLSVEQSKRLKSNSKTKAELKAEAKAEENKEESSQEGGEEGEK